MATALLGGCEEAAWWWYRREGDCAGWDGSRYVEDSDQEQRLGVPPSHMKMKTTQFLVGNDAAP